MKIRHSILSWQNSNKARISKIGEKNMKDMEVLKMGFFLLIIIVLGACKLISEISTETKVTHNVNHIVKQNAEEIKKELNSRR